MEKSKPSTRVRNCVTSVDFPEPEGAEMIKRIPAIDSLIALLFGYEPV